MADSGAVSLVERASAASPVIASLRMQLRVIGALMMREAMTRFGRENIGFFWLMGEPLVLTTGVMISWSIIRSHQGGDIGIVPFVLTGYTLLTLWRHVVGRSVHCFRHNAGLLFHRNVYFIDTLISRVLLEAVGTGTAFFVAYIPLYLLGFIEAINDSLILIGAWLLMMWFAFGVGLIIASWTELAEAAEHFVQPIMYLILPITGTFFMVEWLPQKYKVLAQLSPLVNLNEMFRAGLFGDKIETYWNVPYIIAWCIPLNAIGLLLARKARTRIRFE